MLYTAKCFWPGAVADEIRLAVARASREAVQHHADFRGALYLPTDELALCLFEAMSPLSVKSESESAGMPCERVMETVWIGPEREAPKGGRDEEASARRRLLRRVPSRGLAGSGGRLSQEEVGEMKRLVLLAVAACAAVFVGLPSAAAGSTTVVCTDAFSGTAFNVVVPDDNFCVLSGATITHDLLIGAGAGAGAGVFAGEPGVTVGHDVTLQEDSEVDFGATVIGDDLIATTNDSLHMERTTIRGDLLAFQPATVQTGGVDPESPGGPVHVGRNLVIQGTPPDNNFVFDGLTQLTVDRDFSITDRSVTLGFTVGGDTIGRDLVVTDDTALSGFFGPSSLVVTQNSVGRDLIFTGNTAVPGGALIVSHNVVNRDAICTANDPIPTDGNVVGRTNTCG